MACEDTLKIKNLPKELTDAEKEEFCRHFGATKVKVITSKGRQRSVVYAKFDSKEMAKTVLYRLHQCYVLKNRLCVEFAEYEIGLPKIKQVEETETSNNKEYFKSFLNELNAFNSCVDFQQPPPAHLKYAYPKANRLTINNIGHALASVPKFYTQVLHLMNRMNLPPPFAVEPPRAPPPANQTAQPQNKPPPQPEKPPEKAKSESESELESDEDSKQNKDIIPVKRKIPQKKQVKRPKFIKPSQLGQQQQPGSSKEKPEDVFEKVEVQEKKRIEVKVNPNLDLPSTSTATKTPESKNENDEKETEDVKEEKKGPITEQELLQNQIPEKDLSVLQVFKNYHPGVPTNRLYIKNIAKNVELKDMEYIYSRYKQEGTDEKPSQFDIRLMQEGRMKGQAFITLDSIEIAQKAQKETNAFILKDKPLVVVFAKAIKK